jgi:hypothetical protein
MYLDEPGAKETFAAVQKWYKLDSIAKYPDLYKKLLKAYDDRKTFMDIGWNTGMRMEYQSPDIMIYGGIKAIKISKDGSITVQHPKEFINKELNENRDVRAVKTEYADMLQTLSTLITASIPTPINFEHSEEVTAFLP